MKPDILLFEPLVSEIEDALDRAYYVHRAFDAEARVEAVSRLSDQIRGIVTGGGTGVERSLIERLPALEIIAISGIGTDAVDLALSRSRGIRITTTPDLLTEDVADMAIGLLLSTARKLCVGDRHVRSGAWLRGESLPLARKVSGKKIGILGMGRVGRAIAQRASGFGMQIAYTDLYAMADLPYVFMSDLSGLAQWCEFLVIAAAGGVHSRSLVDASILEAIGPDGILINVARGAIVDETALIDALIHGRLGGAGLDVFVDEPRVPEQLLTLDSLVLQPHRASATLETRAAMGHLLLANLTAHFEGQPLLTAIV